MMWKYEYEMWKHTRPKQCVAAFGRVRSFEGNKFYSQIRCSIAGNIAILSRNIAILIGWLL